MIQRFKYIIALAGVIFSVLISAQTNVSSPNKCGHCIDGKHTNESPYEVSFKNEIPYLATGFGLLGGGLIIRSQNSKDPFSLEELTLLDAGNVNRFDRGATRNNSSAARTASDIILYGGAALPLLFLSNHHTKKDFLPLVVMGAEVYTITGGLTLSTKFLFNRTRPLTYNPEFSNDFRTDENTRLSFISGHTAQTAAFSVFIAKVIHDYHPNSKTGFKIGMWTFALGLPAVAGYLRVKGGKHFNTDVIAGYAVGAAVGFLVPHLHKRKKDSKFSMNFYNNGSANGLSLSWKL